MVGRVRISSMVGVSIADVMVMVIYMVMSSSMIRIRGIGRVRVMYAGFIVTIMVSVMVRVSVRAMIAAVIVSVRAM